MCGGAIIADFIPHRRGRRLTPSDLWPDSFPNHGDFPLDFSLPTQDHSLPVQKPQLSPGQLIYTHFFSLLRI